MKTTTDVDENLIGETRVCNRIVWNVNWFEPAYDGDEDKYI